MLQKDTSGCHVENRLKVSRVEAEDQLESYCKKKKKIQMKDGLGGCY